MQDAIDLQITHAGFIELPPEIDFLNHGSFGATPLDVLHAQREIQDEMESQPVHFMMDVLPSRLRDAAETSAPLLRLGKDLVSFPMQHWSQCGVALV